MEFVAAMMLGAAGAAASVASQAPWQWQPKLGSCVLRQRLNSEGSFLEISRTPGNDQTGIFVEDPRADAALRQELMGASVQLESGGSTVADGFMGSAKSGKGRSVGVTINDQSFMAKFASANAIMLSHDKFGALRTPLRSAAAAARALGECENRKMREWGVDPVRWRALQSRPIPLSRPSKWFTPDDYPLLATVYNVQSDVITLLQVGPDGIVQKCTVTNRSLITEFKDATCRALLRKARFKPAIDAQGNPSAAPFVFVIRYRLSS